MTGETGNKTLRKLPVGISDFKKVIEGNYCYIDKTLLIKEILDKGDSIILIPRPRRFGKTLNLSMLKYFYDCVPPSHSPAAPHPPSKEHSYKPLFQSLAIMEAGQEYREKIGKHPVIFLSFRDIKELDWDSCFGKIKQLIQDEYLKHDYLLDSSMLKSQEKDYFRKIIDLEGSRGDFEISLKRLLVFLNRHYGKRAVILIDEYDAPVHAGFTYDYYEDIINFMRNFLCGGLKDTDQYLEKSVLTGIMRIAKESIFSGLNNPGVYTLLSKAFEDKFGFTEKEVEHLLREFGVFDNYDGVRQWYNGYRFGATTIYNPWSIINYLGNTEDGCSPYWINTSDNRIVETLLTKGGKELRRELEQLIRGESIEKNIDENIILKEVPHREELLWSFLLMGGYLKQTDKRRDKTSVKVYYKLSIPNLEVKTLYARMVDHYFSSRIEHSRLEIMLKALCEGDLDVFRELFSDLVVSSMSFMDPAQDPEKVYHAFVMGLFLWLSPGYEVKSNRESGYGRYDILVIPGDVSRLGYVIEFKKVRKTETLESATESALKQIEEKKYETELIDRGIKNFKKLAIVFKGKEVTITEA